MNQNRRKDNLSDYKRNRDFADIVFLTASFLKCTAEEVFAGVINNRVPARMCYAGILLGSAFYLRFDIWLFDTLGLPYDIKAWLRHVLIYASLMSGWFIWGAARAGRRNRLLSRVRDAFDSAKLKCNGRYPALIEDVRLDENVRKLRLHCNGVSFDDFRNGKKNIEAVLNMTIVKFHQDPNDKGRIEIIYTMQDLDRNVVLESPENFADGEIPIGISHEGAVSINMRNVGHILVAGQTGGGKSNFLKVVTTVLATNASDSEILFLDFKGGMEASDIRNHARNFGDKIQWSDGSIDSMKALTSVGTGLEDRFKEMAAIGAASLDDYSKKCVQHEPTTGLSERNTKFKRTFVIIDEIAQLYSKDPDVDKNLIQSARSAVNRIARQGRAAGIHLIVATQKPDASSFDQTVKSNLPGVLCFPMPNQVSSVSAIGTKRAFDLDPEIKGRAVWKFGPRLTEVQTYYFG